MPGNYRILIVDDEEDIRTIIRQSLQRHYEVFEAFDGLDALQKLPYVEPDFIVLDIMMPLMDGFKACEAIRRDPKFSDVPVLFLSALNTKTDMMKGYSIGATLYLTKPFDPLRLVRNIDLHFESAESAPRPKTHTLAQVREYLERLPESTDASGTSGEMPRPVLGASTPRPAPAAATREAPAAEPTTKPRETGGIVPRIMLVDDDADIIQVLRAGLSDDFEVVAAADGIEAVERIVSYEPDLIMIDALMPRMSGYQLCQSLRRNQRFHETPIIFLSGKSTPKDVQYAERLGATDFIAKPFEMEQVRQRLLKHAEDGRFRVFRKRLSLEAILEIEEIAVRERDQRERARSARTGEEGRGMSASNSADEMRKFLRDELSS